MDFPGLDTSHMSDDQLMNKISELQGKMNYAYMYMGNDSAVGQMQAMIEALSFEQQTRVEKKMYEMEQRNKKQVIETEPDLIQDTKKQEKKAKQNKKGSGSLLQRSKSSTSDGTIDID